MSGPKVAVVGAGPLGLMATKILLEDGFDVTCYERRNYIGGLWKCSMDAFLSITEGTTIFNTSEYRAAFSDFPFPPGTDDFRTADQICRYLEDYCDFFGLRPRIRLNATVIHLRRETAPGSKWIIESTCPTSQSLVTVEYFDKILIATGSFTTPKTPVVQGVQNFEGTILHVMNFHQPQQYAGKTVLIVGLHATAQDVTVSLSKYASKVYISHERGVVMVRHWKLPVS